MSYPTGWPAPLQFFLAFARLAERLVYIPAILRRRHPEPREPLPENVIDPRSLL